MKVNFQLSVLRRVTKCEFDLGLISVQVREEVVAHGNGPVLLRDESGVFEPHLGPGIDGEPTVLGARTAFACDEVGRGFRFGCAELLDRTLRGLEQDRPQIEGVQFVQEVAGERLTLRTRIFEGSDFDHTSAPLFLSRQNLFFGNHDVL